MNSAIRKLLEQDKMLRCEAVITAGMALCSLCGEPMRRQNMVGHTLVGYGNGPCGKPHDDNCMHDSYVCSNQHLAFVYLRRSCPCGWKGKKTCDCHPGNKVDAWPE